MSTEDVIELGSSDDEKEPAAKKLKTSNTMVHIPNQFTATHSGIKKKPAVQVDNKKKFHPEHKIKGKVVEGSKISGGTNIKIGNNMQIGNSMKIENLLPNIIINPKVNSKNANKQRRPIPTRYIPNISGNIKRSTNLFTKQITQGSKILNLPPGTTIKRASTSLRKNPLHASNNKKVRNISHVAIPIAPALAPAVTLHDKGSSSASMPRWYKTPEEEDKNEDKSFTEAKLQSMEEQNNKEPLSRNYVEIIIEDSPIKPTQSQKDIGAITIEDSPVKAGLDKISKKYKSKHNDKQSKKKLNYPQEGEMVDKEMIEIEVDLTENNKEQPENKCSENDHNLYNSIRTEVVSNTKENTDNEVETNSNIEKSKELPDIELEFHPVYTHFIETCFRIENSEDMKKIVEKKIKGYYRQCSKEYVASEEFIDFVSGKIIAIEASPDKMYLYIKDVVDELKLQRKLAKAVVTKQEESQEVAEVYEVDQDKYDSKRQRHIKKLEKTLKKLHRAIQKLEEQEVDFDDEDDSVYLLTERYKERLVKVHAKFCQLTNTKMPSEPSIKLETPPGRHPAPTRKLEKFINKKVPIGAPLPFPDFHDVLQCVKEANEEEKLRLSDMEMIEEARELFIKCGKKLQRRRQENEWRIAASRLPVNEDPAEKDLTLKKLLDNNTQLAAKKESEVFNKFVDRQVQLKLEAVEIGDKEAEESPIESEEDEETDQGNHLESKEKRKERLKRLLQEKSKLDVEKSEATNAIEAKNLINDHPDNKENNESELVAVSDDDKSNAESDFDELHLLQKLYSASEVDSSESPISLSDTDNDSQEECTKGLTVNVDDVISIENSSYSESENNADDVHLSSRDDDNRDIQNAADLQGCSSSVEQSLKETKKAEITKREVGTHSVNNSQINGSPSENVVKNDVIDKEKQLLSKEKNKYIGLPKNVKAKSEEVIANPEKTNIELNSYKEISTPADSRISDESKLLNSSDDDNDGKIMEPNSLHTEEDNISASQISICSIDSMELVDKNLEAGPSNAVAQVTSTDVDDDTSNENIVQNMDRESETSANEIISKQQIALSNECS